MSAIAPGRSRDDGRRTVIFDLDGTLVDSADDLVAALNIVLRPRGLRPADRQEVTTLVGNGARVLLTDILARRGAPFDEAALGDFLAYYGAHAAVATRPFPKLRETLEEMERTGWRFAVCTNKPEAASRALLAGLDLAYWFPVIGGGDSFPTRKPDPAHLLATLAATGGVASEAVMVGDHINDVRAALGAGIPCIFAAWGYGTPAMAEGAAAIASQMTDVPALCERLLPAKPG